MIPRSDKELHRLNKNHNDWDDIPASKFTHLQNIAKKTRGIAIHGLAHSRLVSDVFRIFLTAS
jgi:hypothetical protein